jgi:DNA repair protein RadC
MAVSPPNTPPLPDHLGHRERLRQRLLLQGGDALQDYEVLEYLLMLVIPRRDTKPLAKALLREFGSLGAVLTAKPEELRQRAVQKRDPAFPKDGLGDTVIAALKIVQIANLRGLSNVVKATTLLGSWQALLDYLRADMGHLKHERVRALFLDNKNRLLRDELLSEGSVDQSAIYVREVVKRALELGATAIVLVHNHPSGEASPSRQDILITRDIAEACKRFSIAVHDHIIIAGDTHVSLKSQGLI